MRLPPRIYNEKQRENPLEFQANLYSFLKEVITSGKNKASPEPAIAVFWAGKAMAR